MMFVKREEYDELQERLAAQAARIDELIGDATGHADALRAAARSAEGARSLTVRELEERLVERETRITVLERAVELRQADIAGRDGELVRLVAARDAALGLVEQMSRDGAWAPETAGINDESTRGDS